MRVEIIESKKILTNNKRMFEMLALKYKTEIKIGTILLNKPKAIAPVSLAMINSSVEIGARRSLSKDLDLFSKVIVTASIDVVPKSTDIATIPGKISVILKLSLLKNIISVHAKGKIKPQLILGGLR